MSLSNSFISSFESLEAKAPAARLRYVCHVVCTMLCTLAVIDIGTSLVFPLPTSPIKPANSLANYFQYGRSVRNKIRYIMGTEDGNTNKNALIGWLPEKAIPLPSKDHALTLSVYGMSFSNHVGRALVEMEPTIGLRLFDGLGAPANHTLALFRANEQVDDSEVAVFGILASCVRGLTTVTGMSIGFESPAPYTYPRYRVDAHGELQETWPSVRTLEDMRRVANDNAAWAEFSQELKASDRFFDSRFADEWLDGSSLNRIIRRARAQAHIRELTSKILTPAGYAADQEIGPVLKAISLDFADRCRRRQVLPIVLLIQDRGSSNALWRLLGDDLTHENILVVSTHEVVPTSDPGNFIQDGHFTKAANARVAGLLRDILNREFPQTMTTSASFDSKP